MHSVDHLLIYHVPLGEPDGTSVLLRRLYAPCAARLLHLTFRPGRFPPPPEIPRVHIPGDLPWSFARGARLLRQLYPVIAMPTVAAVSPRLRRARAVRRRRPETALVCVYGNDHAARARVLLRRCEVTRYVLMLMDLLDERPPTLATAPALVALVRNASAVITVSERLSAVVRPYTAAPQLVLAPPCGIAPRAETPRRVGPFRAIATGALYAGRGSFFEKVFLPGWRAFAAQHSDAELLYVGTEDNKLSPSARRHVRALGRLDPEKFAELLAGSSVGVLPVLHEPGSRWQYSVPGRLSDYLAAGLPIVAPDCRDTATADFLAALPRGIVHPAANSTAVERALRRLHDDRTAHAAASAAAVDYARRRLDLPLVRSVFFEWLKRHSSQPDRVSNVPACP
jgi:glycosyltransferase involved in cell wall biosynthesis